MPNLQPDVLTQVHEAAERCAAEVGKVIIGHRESVDVLLCALLARGHVLLEGVPGVAKTTLCKAFSRVLGCRVRRIQVTPDLLPSDITGTHILDMRQQSFVLREGPIFAHVVLGDEINRAPAKTQSALLEAMQEGQVTIEGVTRPLEPPFMVLATQNPIEQEGTYALPEAQLDRFLLKVRIDYPSQEEEAALVRQVITGKIGDRLDVDSVAALVKPATVVALQRIAASLRMDDAVLDYAVRLVRATRNWAGVVAGAGPRGGISLMRAARGAALLEGRDYVTPDDVKKMALPALRHRIRPAPELELEGRDNDAILKGLLEKIDAPRK